MDTPPPGFPRELLTQPWTARLEYFKGYTMAHPRLMAARDALLGAIHERAPNSLILVLGPSGVGKTTLRLKIEQLLITEMLADLDADPGRLPVVSVECIAPESGTFSWRDQFRRLLLQMEEPLLDRKLDPGTSIQIGKRALKFMPNGKAAGPEYRHAVERALCFRCPAAVMLDEAQHLARMGSGRRLSDQLDVIKSIANCTRTVHVLLGTYGLLAFRNLSAQLSRRSVDIHFSRYRADDPDDQKTFLTILRSFEQHIPLAEPPELTKEWEYLYERSIGCVGVLKDWMVRALTGVFKRNATVLTFRDLQMHALSVSQCDQMLAEALEGEVRLFESSEERGRLRTRLGLSAQETRHEDVTVDQVTRGLEIPRSRKQRRRPGQRRPVRDAIARPAGNYAAAPTV
jgi:energy-coupling factor transporter ATP-binding protein EcfA2